jgi:hypothetical protein
VKAAGGTFKVGRSQEMFQSEKGKENRDMDRARRAMVGHGLFEVSENLDKKEEYPRISIRVSAGDAQENSIM